MDRREFSEVRGRLGKTQKQMAQLLAVSLKAVQSFEQGWRRVPVHVERQMLILLALREAHEGRKPCWDIKACPKELRENCPAWEFQSGHLCWFISGTMCHGKAHGDWPSKMKVCRNCTVLQSMLAA